eukprot:tig00021073_g18063.t1
MSFASFVVWVAKGLFSLFTNAVLSDIGVTVIGDMIAQRNPNLDALQRQQLTETLRRVVRAMREGRTEAAVRAVGGILALTLPSNAAEARSECGPGPSARTGAGAGRNGGAGEDIADLAGRVITMLFAQARESGAGSAGPAPPPPFLLLSLLLLLRPRLRPERAAGDAGDDPAVGRGGRRLGRRPSLRAARRAPAAAAGRPGAGPSGSAGVSRDEAESLEELLVAQFGMNREKAVALPDVLKPALVRALSEKDPTCCITLDPLLDARGRLTGDVAALAQPRAGSRHATAARSPDDWHVHLFRDSALQDWFRSSREPRNPVTRDRVDERSVFRLS